MKYLTKACFVIVSGYGLAFAISRLDFFSPIWATMVVWIGGAVFTVLIGIFLWGGYRFSLNFAKGRAGEESNQVGAQRT